MHSGEKRPSSGIPSRFVPLLERCFHMQFANPQDIQSSQYILTKPIQLDSVFSPNMFINGTCCIHQMSLCAQKKHILYIITVYRYIIYSLVPIYFYITTEKYLHLHIYIYAYLFIACVFFQKHHQGWATKVGSTGAVFLRQL